MVVPIRSDADVPFEAITAGAIVSARVSAVLSNGIAMKVCGYIDASAGCDHLPLGGGATPSRTAAKWASMYKPGSLVCGRVLWVLPESKSLGVSLATHLVEGGLNCGWEPPKGLRGGVKVKASVQMVLKSTALLGCAPMETGNNTHTQDAQTSHLFSSPILRGFSHMAPTHIRRLFESEEQTDDGDAAFAATAHLRAPLPPPNPLTPVPAPCWARYVPIAAAPVARG